MVKAKGEAKVTDMVEYGMWDGEEEEEERRKQKKSRGEKKKIAAVIPSTGLLRVFWLRCEFCFPARHCCCCATVREILDAFLDSL